MAPVTERTVKCPPQLQTLVALDQPDVKGWILGGPQQIAQLKGARLFIGKPNKDNIDPSNEIKPIPHIEHVETAGVDKKGAAIVYDRQIFRQEWNLEGPNNGNLFLVCDYLGIDNYVMRALDPVLKRCNEADPIDKTDSAPIHVQCD